MTPIYHLNGFSIKKHLQKNDKKVSPKLPSSSLGGSPRESESEEKRWVWLVQKYLSPESRLFKTDMERKVKNNFCLKNFFRDFHFSKFSTFGGLFLILEDEFGLIKK